MDALSYFKDKEISIDCLVTLCESRGEGGQTYAMCSDVFMGYYMQVLRNDFIWICNDSKYYGFSAHVKGSPTYRKLGVTYDEIHNKYKRTKMRDLYGRNYVSLDLPYEMTELTSGDEGYINPGLFSSLLNESNKGHVFKMHYSPSIKEYTIAKDFRIRLIQDSIWNYYNSLDALHISFWLEDIDKKDFFTQHPKVSYYEQLQFGQKLRASYDCGYEHIGFTPHYIYQYDKVYQKQLESFALEIVATMHHPFTVDFFYLSSWFHTRHIEKAIKTLNRSIKRHGTASHVVYTASK